MLEKLASRIQRPHHFLRNLCALAGMALGYGNVVRVRQFRRVLIPWITAGVEIGVPHQNRRMIAVMFQKTFDFGGVTGQFLVFIRDHLEEIVEPLTVRFVKIFRPCDLKRFSERIEADRVIVHFFDMGNVLSHGFRVAVIVPHPVQTGARPHAQTQFLSVHAEAAVFDPCLAETEIFCRESIGIATVLFKRHAHTVKIRVFRIPEHGIRPFFREDDKLLR